MKKIILILFVFFLLSTNVVFATSGACSHHGGVSCAAGPDSDGSVICTDGWTESSVSYSSMVMCRSYHTVPVTHKPAVKKMPPTVVPSTTVIPNTPPAPSTSTIVPTPEVKKVSVFRRVLNSLFGL